MPVCVFLGVVYQSQGLLENIALVIGVGEVATWDLCHRLKRMVTLQ